MPFTLPSLGMMENEAIIDTFLQSIRFRPPGGRTMFLSGNGSGRFSGIVVTVYTDFSKRKESAIKLLKRFPRFFEGKSISDASDILSRFLTSDFSAQFDLGLGLFPPSRFENAAETIPVTEYEKVWNALETFIMGLQKTHLHLFPGHKIEVHADVVHDELVLIRLDSDMAAALKQKISFCSLKNGFFPPIEQEERRQRLPDGTSWIGCFTTDQKFPESRIRSIAGGIFMAAPLGNSRIFNMASSLKGRVSLSEVNCTYKYDEPVIPQLYHPIILNARELDFLQNIIISKAGDQRFRNALKSIYEGWITKDRERFVNFAIALDALFGVKGRVGKSIFDGVTKYASSIPEIDKRVLALTNMRNKLAHGASVEVESCPGYIEYLEQFGKDPADDQFEILRTCLWTLSAVP